MKIRALNEKEETNSSTVDSLSEDGGRQQTLSHEALEEQFFQKYQSALIAIRESREQDAREALEDLHSHLEDIDDSQSIVQLKYSVLKNLGDVNTDDIKYYMRAVEIDSTDISLWIKMGYRASKLENHSLARLCYEQTLKLNPNHWVAIDRLMEIYYILHLPIELFDICMKALTLDSNHAKAKLLIQEAIKHNPSLRRSHYVYSTRGIQDSPSNFVSNLYDLKVKRRQSIQEELRQPKRVKLGITLDTTRTQSLSSFGNYIVKIYERFAKQGLTRNSVIDITLNNSIHLMNQQQASVGSANSQQSNNASCEPNSSSQDVEMVVEGDINSISDTDKSNNRLEQTTSNDENEQTKSNSRSGSNNNNTSSCNNNQSNVKSSSLSFAAMLFPMDLGDKRRSSRNRSNQDDTFSFKMKFDELNDLLPETLRIGAIEEALQKRRKEQEKSSQEQSQKSPEEAVLTETNLDPVREDLIIKDIIENISTIKTQSVTMSNEEVKLCDILFLYLHKIAINKQNSLPDAYAKIYKIYRKLCPIKSEVYIEIGPPDGMTVEELWFTLTANELTYQDNECHYMLRLLDQLSLHLTDPQHREFSVRLFLVLGTNSDHRYLDAALQTMGEDAKIYASNRRIITRAYIKTLIDKANERLQQADESSDDPIELIERLATKSESEMSDREISSLCSAIKTASVWQKGLDILNRRNDLNSDIIMDTINICLKNGAIADAILTSKLCKDAISGNRPTSWTCLYRCWVQALTDEELQDEDTVSDMDKFFDLGHQTLGRKCLCTIDKGEFLMLYVKHLVDDRDNYEERDLFGAMNCLFGYPSKKPAAVAGHKAARVPIIWEYAETLYDYLELEESPTYMSSLRKVGLTSEVEPLFREIASVVPAELSPETNVMFVEDYIEGKCGQLRKAEIESHRVTENIFYFLADFYFKNKDFAKAKQYYHLDLVLNPTRFDSWAASGLIRANGIDKALSEGTISTCADFLEGSFPGLIDATVRCFEEATKLKPDEPNATLWVEFGNLTYNLTSLASRLYSCDDFEEELTGKSALDNAKLRERHHHLYELAQNCFESAHTLCQSEEIWLHYYMLGKIHEKTSSSKALEYYSKADAQLFQEGASYPKKISYHNPPELAYEAMEVHYRIHATVLKFLLSADQVSSEVMDLFRYHLNKALRSPFVLMEGVPDPQKRFNIDIHRDVIVLVDDIVESLSHPASFDELIYLCLHGMKRCLIRCDKNFKAIFRLAHYYFKIGNYQLAQAILVSREIPSDPNIACLKAQSPALPYYRVAPPDLRGTDSLFKDRKQGNMFFNIWRLPVEEVDRPGSFEHWIFKATLLLIKTCIELNDVNTLSTIAYQLSRQPDTSKRYLHDRPRKLLAQLCVKEISQSQNQNRQPTL